MKYPLGSILCQQMWLRNRRGRHRTQESPNPLMGLLAWYQRGMQPRHMARRVSLRMVLACNAYHVLHHDHPFSYIADSSALLEESARQLIWRKELFSASFKQNLFSDGSVAKKNLRLLAANLKMQGSLTAPHNREKKSSGKFPATFNCVLLLNSSSATVQWDHVESKCSQNAF